MLSHSWWMLLEKLLHLIKCNGQRKYFEISFCYLQHFITWVCVMHFNDNLAAGELGNWIWKDNYLKVTTFVQVRIRSVVTSLIPMSLSVVMPLLAAGSWVDLKWKVKVISFIKDLLLLLHLLCKSLCMWWTLKRMKSFLCKWLYITSNLFVSMGFS